MFSQLWQHGSKNLETQILFVSKLIGAPLDDADLVVQPFDEPQRDFVFRSAVSSDAMPMVLDHLSEFLIGRTSTAWVRSNRLRLYFSSFAYIWMQRLRQLGLKGTELAQAQCETIRLKLFKIGAQVAVTRRKVWISFSASYPYLGLFQRVFARLQQSPSGA